MVEFLIGICLLAFIFGFTWVVMTIIRFFDAVPKQLKRMADALERMEKKDGLPEILSVWRRGSKHNET